MSKYTALLKILDQIRIEGIASGYASYRATTSEVDALNHARSKAYIHLFLKVSFGILDFRERENFITDGSQDGGIDGYYIDRDTRTIFFFQAKFRTTEENFRSKQITLNEIGSMDISRIASGEIADERGNEYNGKIKGLIRNISAIDDIGRYKYQVVVIANLANISTTTLRNLVGGFPVEIFDAERCYAELVFPILSGTYFQKEELSIFLDLSNKNAGSKITYEVATDFGDCDITVLFVPTLEIAKIMQKYRNAILKYNPRSYLEFDGAPVNDSIRQTILSGTSNEFALLNNGITMVSDETNINERIGQKNKAQLFVKNPQIINGGQTAYTLSRIYQENSSTAESIFAGKEVLLKVITLTSERKETADPGVKLIELISAATNRQTAVTNSDRHSGDDGFEQLQKTIFDRFGVLFERKRGEFGDGLRDGYVDHDQIIDRITFAKIFFAATGSTSIAISKKAFLKIKDPGQIASDAKALERFYYGYRYYLAIGRPPIGNKNKITVRRIAAFVSSTFDASESAQAAEKFNDAVESFEKRWTHVISEYNAQLRAQKEERRARRLAKEESELLQTTSNQLKTPRNIVEYFTQNDRGPSVDDPNELIAARYNIPDAGDTADQK
ncbi:AIPR family protein [Bradyrhizobium liaoningense]